MKIINHLLEEYENLSFEHSTPNKGGKFPNNQPDTIVIHFTAGGSAASSARYLCKPSSKASAHIVVGRDGKIFQLAPFNVITWHAGRSSWKGRTGLNKYSIGIEIDNAGQLTKNENGTYQTWFGKKINASDVYFGKHRNQTHSSYWHTYSEVQMQLAFDLCELLIQHYPIREIVGHEEIAPSRKTDPGPAFPLDKLRDRWFGDTRNEDGGVPDFSLQDTALVNVNRLNIRSGPGVNYPTVSQPLNLGDSVSIKNSKNGWVQVEHITKGWVSERYLKTFTNS